MDPQEKDEARARLREEALARRMGEALDRISATSAGECPEAGLIAAYHEQALTPEELAQYEGHFAGCSRCRKILAVLAASVDAPLAETEVARLGELVAAAARPGSVAAPRPAKIIKSIRFDWRTRWLAPALGVAAVFAVWFAMRPPSRAPGAGASGTLVAQAPRSEAPLGQENSRSMDQGSGVETKKAPESSVAIPLDRLSERKAPANSAPQLPETDLATDRKSLDQNQLKAKAATTEGRLDNQKEGAAGQASRANEAMSSAAAPPSAILPAPQIQAAKGESSAPAFSAQAMSNSPAREKQAVGGASSADAVAAPRPAPAMPMNGRGVQALSMASKGESVVGLKIQSPSGKVLWRAGMGGKTERSIDGGGSWIAQASPSQQDWLAGAAASDTVCWLVGRNGSIARTEDGEHWVQVASPPGTDGTSGQFPDWTGVTAGSALAATITSSGNLRYRTVDGGRTWRLQ